MPPEIVGPFVLGAAAFIAGTVLTLSTGFDIFDGLRSTSWPTTKGRVLGHTHVRGLARGPIDDAVVIAYRYEVEGREYVGLRYDYAGRNSVGRGVSVLTEYYARRQVLVHYDPKRPDRAVLRPGVGPWTFAPLLVGVPLAWLGAAPVQVFLAWYLSR